MRGALSFVVTCIWNSLAAGQQLDGMLPTHFSVESERAGPTSERVALGFGTCIIACYDRELTESKSELAWLSHLISVQGGMRIDGSHIRESWEFLDKVHVEKPRRLPFEYLQAVLPLL